MLQQLLSPADPAYFRSPSGLWFVFPINTRKHAIMNQSEARLHSGRSVHFCPSLSPRPSSIFSEGLVPRLGQWYPVTTNIIMINCSLWCIFVPGKRFRYTHYNKSDGPIHASIEALDRMVSLGLGCVPCNYTQLNCVACVTEEGVCFWWLSSSS